MRTILVTGGAGFIGSCLVRRLLTDDGTRVVNLDKLTYAGNLDSLSPIRENPLHHFHQCDICDRSTVVTLLNRYRPAAVMNLAAESHVDRSIDSPGDFIRTNVNGTFELLEAARSYWSGLSADVDFRFLHISTDEVFGSLGPTGAFTEGSPYAPNSPYSSSKASSDHLVRAYFHTYGLPVLTTNCSNNYGPYQFPEKLIPLMVLNAVEGRPLPIYGDGSNIRDWLHVEDHVSALLAVLEHGIPGEVYNIGGECERTNLEVVHTICDAVERSCPHLPHAPCSQLIEYVRDRPGHDRRYAMDITKIRRELGWSPSMTFESGIANTVRWYLENKEWVERVTSGSYRQERLG